MEATLTARKPMNLIGGMASFWSKFSSQGCYPCGDPSRRIVEDGSRQIVLHVDRPRVKFSNNFYQTENPEIALGLVRDKVNFAQNAWGWNLDVQCIPLELREFWPQLGREWKAKVAAALIEGASTEEVFDLIPPEEITRTKTSEGNSGQLEYVCPVSGCGLRTSGGPSAQATIVTHVRLMHPDYKGK
jgi:hypothetical protein